MLTDGSIKRGIWFDTPMTPVGTGDRKDEVSALSASRNHRTALSRLYEKKS